MSSTREPVDAILLLSFGGPEGPDEVIPFLENVLRGKNVPRHRLEEVAEHYHHFGGVSPINEQCRALIAALQAELDRSGIDLPIYWGNRNWHPLLATTLQEMAQAGVRRALAFVTSVFSSYSGCRQYLEDIDKARKEVGPGAPEVQKLRSFFNHPGFVETMRIRTTEALEQLPPSDRRGARFLFTAHSIPLAMAESCAYQAQLQEACRLVVEPFTGHEWELVYQSRSGPPAQPWLEPDVCDRLKELHAAGDAAPIVVIPIGFISDHMEVRYDLDTEARQLCDQLGMTMVRAQTAGTHPRFVRMIRELIEERLYGRPRLALGSMPAAPDVCPPDCCLSGRTARTPSHP